MRRRIQWSHKKSKRAAEQKPAGVETTVEIVAPMRSVPLWLIDNTVMKVSMTEEAPEEFADGAATRGYKGWRGFWREVRERLTPEGTASKIYEYAGSRNSMWAESFKYIDVLSPNGEPVGWYDLDGGLVQYVTLHDLIFQPQPMIQDGRKLFMMTETMWENREYPPEVGSRTTSAEPSGKMARDAERSR